MSKINQTIDVKTAYKLGEKVGDIDPMLHGPGDDCVTYG